MKPVGFWMRFAAAIIDSLLLGTLASLIAAPIAAMITPMIAQNVAMSGNIYAAMLQSVLVSFAISGTLYALMEARMVASKWRATPGKMILGMVVTGYAGEQLSFWRSFNRHIWKHVSAIIAGIGFFMIAFDKQKRGLHDRVMKTLVVKKESLQGMAA